MRTYNFNGEVIELICIKIDRKFLVAEASNFIWKISTTINNWALK